MPSGDSSTDDLASFAHRSVLGVLLAVFALFAVGWGWRVIGDGYLVVGAGGIVLGAGAAYWIYDLFVEGLRGD